MSRKVTRYRSKVNGRYISKAQWLRDRKQGTRARERYVKGERRPMSELGKLLRDAAGKTIVVRKQYKNRKIRNPVHLELTYVSGKLTQAKVGRNTYTRPQDFEALSALINAATEV